MCKDQHIRKGLLDHLVGAGEERLRDLEPECLGGLQVDHQVVFGRLLHGSRRPVYSLLEVAPELYAELGSPDTGERLCANQQVRTGYSITSSARARRVGGIVMPSAFAVAVLTTSSKPVGCSMGKSLGEAPFKIAPT